MDSLWCFYHSFVTQISSLYIPFRSLFRISNGGNTLGTFLFLCGGWSVILYSKSEAGTLRLAVLVVVVVVVVSDDTARISFARACSSLRRHISPHKMAHAYGIYVRHAYTRIIFQDVHHERILYERNINNWMYMLRIWKNIWHMYVTSWNCMESSFKSIHLSSSFIYKTKQKMRFTGDLKTFNTIIRIGFSLSQSSFHWRLQPFVVSSFFLPLNI